MRYVTAEAYFGSTHLDAAEGPHLHGHTFHVSITELGTEYGLRGDLEADLQTVVAELNLRDLREMLVGGSQTLDGIAAWVMERLLLNHPRITRAEAWVADKPWVRAGLTREIR